MSRSAPGLVLHADVELRPGPGPVRYLDVRAVNLLGDDSVGGVVLTLHDATDRRNAAEELSRQAFHDSLTGLANRALFRDRLQQALLRSARSGLDPAVLFLDLDGFKKVNDSMGHEAGDALLAILSARIEQSVRSQDTVARLGGDEFAILIEESDSPVDDAITAADRVISAVSQPAPIGDREIVLSASIGIDIGGLLVDASAVLRNADIAMYRAKGAGKGRWVLFDSTMRAVALERLELEIDLARALDAGQFRLEYQPVLSLETGVVAGFEALLRWDHPTYGSMPPGSFIPIAEETGQIVAIGAWALREACRQSAEWRRSTPERVVRMGVNVSGVQVAHPALVGHVADALRDSGWGAEDLVLEMTESVLVADPVGSARRLQELRGLGVQIAIDDFGTGYSSLSYLRQFSVDILKIDQSFVNSISEQDGLPALIRGRIDLGRTLDLDVVAEGIELADQLHILREAQCPFGQGFLFARPLRPEAAFALLDGTATVGGVDGLDSRGGLTSAVVG